MNRLKRYFPIPYLLLATLGIGLIIREMIRGPQVSLAEVGALLAIVPLVAFMSSLLMFKRARTSRNQYLMLALSLIATGLAFVWFASPASWYALFLGVVPSFAYVFWYSVLDRPVPVVIAVGETLPELELVDEEGVRVTPSPRNSESSRHGVSRSS